jgi:hypothetical protein
MEGCILLAAHDALSRPPCRLSCPCSRSVVSRSVARQLRAAADGRDVAVPLSAARRGEWHTESNRRRAFGSTLVAGGHQAINTPAASVVTGGAGEKA